MSIRSHPAVENAGSYARVAQMIATDRCVILDGAIGTELIDVGRHAPRARRAPLGPDRDPRRARRGQGRCTAATSTSAAT